MQIVAFDFGEKKIGVAVGQTSTYTSSPLQVIFNNHDKVNWNEISILLEEWKPELILIGKPLNMDGTEGPSAQSVKDKIKLMHKDLDIPTILWDERLSTVGSFNLSRELDINVSKRVKNIDQNSATFILQGVLDYLAK